LVGFGEAILGVLKGAKASKKIEYQALKTDIRNPVPTQCS